MVLYYCLLPYGAILLPSPYGAILLMYSCGFSFFFRSCLREYFEDWISHSLTCFIDLFSLCRKLLKLQSISQTRKNIFGAGCPCRLHFLVTNRRINICRLFIQVLYSAKICGKQYKHPFKGSAKQQKKSQALPSVRVYHVGYFSSAVIYICIFYVINVRKMITIHGKITCFFVNSKRGGG